jgi:hypothetical protein
MIVAHATRIVREDVDRGSVQILSTNPKERLNKEIKRRTAMVGTGLLGPSPGMVDRDTRPGDGADRSSCSGGSPAVPVGA